MALGVVLGLAVHALTGPGMAYAQTLDVPRSAVTQPGGVPAEIKPFDTTHLADRPYTFNLPKPAFPASTRTQRQFVVEYVYDYAMSSYTPEVAIPTVTRAVARQDTPEAAFIAFFSAARQGDYTTWVSYWDDDGQKALAAEAKDEKKDAAYWRKVWAQYLPQTVPILLTARVETQNYVILDARLGGPKPFGFPTVLRFVNGKWYVTNQLSENPMLYRFNPALAGSLNLVPPMPVGLLDQHETHQIDAQQKFLDDHTVRSRVVEAGH